MAKLRASVRKGRPRSKPLNAGAAKACVTFLNQPLPDGLLSIVQLHSDVGQSGGVWGVKRKATAASLLSLDAQTATLEFDVTLKARDQPEQPGSRASVVLPGGGPIGDVDQLRAALLALCSELPEAGSVLLQLPGASDAFSLPDDMWLNTTPYPHSVRHMFYSDVSSALQSAVADPDTPRRMRALVTPPELNMEMDSYRVGTLLELVREVALDFARAGLRTRLCVQGSMGEGALAGVPRVLSGVKKVRYARPNPRRF